MTNKEYSAQFLNSYNSTKCNGSGNGMKQSNRTAKMRREVNKKRRNYSKNDLRNEENY
jgi:hypothetical protein